MLLVEKTERLLEGFSKLFPKVPSKSRTRGLESSVQLRMDCPASERCPEHPHTFFALGYGGNGITFSVTAADLFAIGGPAVPIPVAALFAFDR